MAGSADATAIWISLRAGYLRVQARFGGRSLPSRMIKAGIEAGRVRSRAWFYKGRIAGDPNIDDQSFWHPGTPLINWKQSSIKRQHGGWNGKGYTAHQVEVRLEDIDALIAAWATAREPMPAPDPEPAKPKRWFSLARET